MLIFAISCLAAGVGATPAISFSPSSVTLASGESADVAIILSEAPDGLAGYELTLSPPISIVRATGATFPSWATLNNKKTKTSGFTISGVDINKAVQSGSTDIQLATVTFTGNTSGSTSVAISGLRMSADGGDDIIPTLGTLSVRVTNAGSATPPTTATTTATAVATTTATTATTTAAEGATTVVTAETTAPVVTATTSTIKGMPIAGFTAKPGYGKPPLTVHFYDRSAGAPVSWEWDFGDGGTSLTQNPIYSYHDEGSYTVTLRVTNTIGSSKVLREGYVIVSNTYVPPPTTEPVTEESTVTTVVPTKVPATTKMARTAIPATTTTAPLEPVVSVIGIGAVLAGSALYSRRQGR